MAAGVVGNLVEGARRTRLRPTAAHSWKLAGLRPLNRPERRLAALAQIVPRMTELLAALKARDAERFSATLLGIRDRSEEKHATLTGAPLSNPCRLLGEERVHDMLINVFWPMVSLEEPDTADAALRKFQAAPNGAARIATQRLLISALTPKQAREALVQQGAPPGFPRLLPDRLLAMPGLHVSRAGEDVEVGGSANWPSPTPAFSH